MKPWDKDGQFVFRTSVRSSRKVGGAIWRYAIHCRLSACFVPGGSEFGPWPGSE